MVIWAVCCAFGLTACSQRLEPQFYSITTPQRNAVVASVSSFQSRSIEWKTLLNPREQEELEAWRLGVGSPVILQAVEQKAQDASIDSLLLLSWNTDVGGADLDRFLQELRQGQLPGTTPRQAVILLLQEVYRSDASIPDLLHPEGRSAKTIRNDPPSGERLDILEIARKHKLSLYYVPSMRNDDSHEGSFAEDRGNAILSNLRLHTYQALELPFERQRRVVIGASVSGRTSGGRLWTLQLVNVHLDNRSRWHRVFDSFGRARLRQTSAILEAALANTPTVIGGDFNTWFKGPDEPAVQLFQQYFDLQNTQPGAGTLAPGLGLPEWTTDYLFFRLPESWSAEYHRLETRYGSDHYPLLGRIQLGMPRSSR